jgi:hypothetical protein
LMLGMVRECSSARMGWLGRRVMFILYDGKREFSKR